ncbi:MAG: GNAT family N-acetyltransferase [Proteobacteria bacterium]|nr:GNAT family N-acetyltransferase [Pseudomonadota bacterium]
MAATADDPLANIVWNSLAGPHAGIAEGDARTRRYRRGYSPFVASADPARPDLDAWRALSAPGEGLCCFFWEGPVPSGWTLGAEKPLAQMTWDAEAPAEDAAPDAVPLTPAHVAQVLALTDLTKPGPFGPRTIEMGEYFGLFDGERLVAMAGERMCSGAWHEVSGVCTHPDYRGQGLARRLMLKVIHRQALRGKRTFLHVLRDNEPALALYRAMGFGERRAVLARFVAHD